eukprot:1159531-Pelagomonas_calceolata.AAC.4
MQKKKEEIGKPAPLQNLNLASTHLPLAVLLYFPCASVTPRSSTLLGSPCRKHERASMKALILSTLVRLSPSMISLLAAFGAPIGGVVFAIEQVSSFFSPNMLWHAAVAAGIALYITLVWMGVDVDPGKSAARVSETGHFGCEPRNFLRNLAACASRQQSVPALSVPFVCCGAVKCLDPCTSWWCISWSWCGHEGQHVVHAGAGVVMRVNILCTLKLLWS